MDSTQLHIASYYCKVRGADRIDYMKHLLTYNDVLFIQEHWYTELGLYDFDGLFEDFFVIGIYGMNENEILLGRPYGGCAIIYNNRTQCTVGHSASNCPSQ